MEKPKPINKTFSAKEIRTYIKHKYKKTSPEFWDWFFSETPWGEDKIIDADTDEFYVDSKFKPYILLIIDEFGSYNDGLIKIEYDF